MTDLINVTQCPLCGDNGEHEKVLNRPYYECHKCGMIYRSPRYSDEHLDKFYQTENYHESRGLTPAFIDANEHRRSKRIAGLLPIGGKRLLDVGCARGYLLEFARNRGYEIMGVEACEGFTFADIPHVQSIDEVEDTFDVISCIHTLEHVPDFVSLADKMVKLLEPYGMLIVEVPGTSSGGVFTDVHINVFKPAVLSRLFEPLKQLLLKFTPHTFMTFLKDA